ncbi:hypothetical protein T492DRAFT_1033899 [Pavlovales sp. CCMP2436]|nr:hypothetical protein T492DRAFT_1033899 [Pavlovales sp. CCMP2436]|mmetsp:Transcript_43951/g.108771  ORF Transcript_43951/g.108771 Transcript_43951/m.108771 type:complete len:350 (-) Transcript_43951:142-1191(-)
MRPLLPFGAIASSAALSRPVAPLMLDSALVAGASWFAFTLVGSTYTNTAFLKAGGSATELTLIRIAGSAVLGALLLGGAGEWLELMRTVQKYASSFVLPAVCLFLANLCNSVALERCGITLTYVTKAAGPVAAILLCFLGYGVLPTLNSLLAVPFVIGGVALSIWSNTEFEKFGFLAACCSTIFQTFLGLAGRNAMVKTGLSGEYAQLISCALILSASAVQWAGSAAVRAVSGKPGGKPPGSQAATRAALCNPRKLRKQLPARVGILSLNMLRLLCPLAFYLEYTLMFTFASKVDSVTLSVSDTVRRAAIVYVGRVLFGGDALLPINKMGIFTALAGALLYTLLAVGPG